MKKIIKITENDLTRIVRKVIKERMEDFEPEDEYYNEGPNNVNDVIDEWENKTDDSFYGQFIDSYPTLESFRTVSISDIEDEFENFPGEDYFIEFIGDLKEVGW